MKTTSIVKFGFSETTITLHVFLRAQSCLALCDPVDCNLPGCSVCGISQARILEQEESRWRRSRTGRALSLLQIHRKNNRTVNKVYKTTSDRQQQISGAQKSSPLSSKGGRTKILKIKKGHKRTRDGDLSWEGSLNRGSFQSPGNPRAGGSEGSFPS